MIARSAALLLAVALGCVGDACAEAPLVHSRPNPAPYRFFGDRTVTVPLVVHGQERDGLVIHGDLVQLASHLSTPIAASLPLMFSASPSARQAMEVDFSLALPAVKREADFELRFRSRLPGGEWQPAGRIALRVYPADLLSPVRTWARSHAIRVEDDDGELAELFRRLGIPLAGERGSAGITFYAGPRTLQKKARAPLRERETAVLFIERDIEIPHVLIERGGLGTTVRIEMRLVGRLAEDPSAQKILVELIQLLNEHAPPPTKGVIQ